MKWINNSHPLSFLYLSVHLSACLSVLLSASQPALAKDPVLESERLDIYTVQLMHDIGQSVLSAPSDLIRGATTAGVDTVLGLYGLGQQILVNSRNTGLDLWAITRIHTDALVSGESIADTTEQWVNDGWKPKTGFIDMTVHQGSETAARKLSEDVSSTFYQGVTGTIDGSIGALLSGDMERVGEGVVNTALIVLPFKAAKFKPLTVGYKFETLVGPMTRGTSTALAYARSPVLVIEGLVEAAGPGLIAASGAGVQILRFSAHTDRDPLPRKRIANGITESIRMGGSGPKPSDVLKPKGVATPHLSEDGITALDRIADLRIPGDDSPIDLKVLGDDPSRIDLRVNKKTGKLEGLDAEIKIKSGAPFDDLFHFSDAVDAFSLEINYNTAVIRYQLKPAQKLFEPVAQQDEISRLLGGIKDLEQKHIPTYVKTQEFMNLLQSKVDYLNNRVLKEGTIKLDGSHSAETIKFTYTGFSESVAISDDVVNALRELVAK